MKAFFKQTSKQTKKNNAFNCIHMCYEIKPIIQVAGWGEGLSSCSCMNIFNLHAPFSQLTKKKKKKEGAGV